jgi:hypothetical protein
LVRKKSLPLGLGRGSPSERYRGGGNRIETGIDKATLNNLRGRYRYIIPRSVAPPRATGRGGASFYPPETAPIIRRLEELRKETRGGADNCLWRRLWLEDHRVDIRGWAAERLDQWNALLGEVLAGMTGEMLKASVSKRRISLLIPCTARNCGSMGTRRLQ